MRVCWEETGAAAGLIGAEAPFRLSSPPSVLLQEPDTQPGAGERLAQGPLGLALASLNVLL